MKKLFLFLIIGISASQVFSQHSTRAYRALADSLYKYHNYKDAALYYERAIRNAPDSADIMLRIARAYSEINSVKEAEAWYTRAIARKAAFQPEDTYHHVKDLLKLERRMDAELVLRDFLKNTPDDEYARSLLADILQIEKYFADSATFTLTPLAAINTPASEFAPVFYGDGLLFTTARTKGMSKRKYHWDKSFFLSLYHAPRTADQQFQKPVPFGKEIHSDFHDGPASLYAQDQRMILNRNVQSKIRSASDVYISHLALVDAEFDAQKKTWRMLPLPFADSAYSFAHPHISEDGNTLYFVSDKPGGYGGTDIYVSTRQNGQWSVPLNLGTVVNTPENEVFPYYVDNTLYFASDGHGGLGGLDLWRSARTPNGFTLPQNLGYPMNSHLDDFSLITRDHQQGYFSSSRGGNDDLFEFHRKPRMVKLLARLHDGVTKVSLPEADIEVLTGIRDMALVSGNGGHIDFELPEASPYILIARKGDKTGIFAGFAESSADRDHVVHEVALYADTASVACVGVVKAVSGLPGNVVEVRIIDEASGEVMKGNFVKSLISFPGKRGHTYRVEVKSAQGHTATQTVEVKQEDKGTKTWSMEVRDDDAFVMVQVRVLNEITREAIAGAKVTLTTLAAPDQELTTNENGEVQARLAPNGAYVVVASKDEYAGMQYGFAEAGHHMPTTDTVLMKSNGLAPGRGMVLVTNAQGEILKNVTVTIIDDNTGVATVYHTEDGLLAFTSSQQAYTIRVARNGYTTVEKKIIAAGKTTEKVPVVLYEDAPVAYAMAVRVIRGEDQMPVQGAEVNIMKFSDQDLKLMSGAEGIVDFKIPDGEGYIIAAAKNGLTGMYVGIAEQGSDKSSVIHSLVLNSAASDSSLAYGIVTNQEGGVVQNPVVVITDTGTAEKILGKIENGILSFPAKPGASYHVVISADNYVSEERNITAEASNLRAPLPTIRLRKQVPVAVKIGDQNGQSIQDAQVIVRNIVTGQEVVSEVNDGMLTFTSEQGMRYSITANHQDYETVSDEVIVPRWTNTVAPRHILMSSKGNRFAARVLMANDSLPVPQASVKVMSFIADDMDMTSRDDGMVDFKLSEDLSYMIIASKGDYAGMYVGISEKASVKSAVVHTVVITKNPKDRLMVITRVSDENHKPIAAADVVVTDKSTGEKVIAKVENGFLAFYGKKGIDYQIDINANGYEPAAETLSIKASATEVDPLNITLHAIQKAPRTASLHVTLASDNTSVAQAAVKVISFAADDINLTSDEAGNVYFGLPEGSAYMAVANKEKYFGIYSGVLSGNEQPAPVPIIVLKDDASDLVPVIGLLVDGRKQPVSKANVVVTDNQTGESIAVQVNQGMLVFFGKKGGDYKIEVTSDAYETQIENIKISPDAVSAQEIEIAITRRKLLVLPPTSTLVMVYNETPHVYITATDAHDEIVEENGILYLKNAEGTRELGQGSLKTLVEDPYRYIVMNENQWVKLDNIYFDFNSTSLDEADQQVLNSTTNLMVQYPRLQLAINTHADTRGSARYNLQLTRRRARAVKSYLVKHGIKTRRIEARAYGKSTPAVICLTSECSEEQHQKNRRGEFELATRRKSDMLPTPIVKSGPTVMKPSARARVSSDYATLLTKYGDIQKEGLVFKVCIGAYRLNPDLTFQEFTDLGTVERQERDGIHYYYLQGFVNMKLAEEIRQQIIMRGINDAYIAIFYKDNNISFSRFISIIDLKD